MKRWIALIVLVGSLWAGPAAMAGGERAARLQFEQICPSDASIAPFALEIGSGVRSTRSTIFVTPETFDEVWSSLKRASGPVRNPCPTGTLRVTYSESGKLGSQLYDLPGRHAAVDRSTHANALWPSVIVTCFTASSFH
jgi:hypothetical protein